MLNVDLLLEDIKVEDLSLEALMSEIDYLSKREVLEDSVLGYLYRAVVDFIVRILNNIKTKFKVWNGPLSRTAMRAYIESNALGVRHAKSLKYSDIANKTVATYTWNCKIELLPAMFTNNIDDLAPIATIKAINEAFSEIVSGVKQGDNSIITKKTAAISVNLKDREVKAMTAELLKTVITRVSKVGNRFGDVFASMDNFGKASDRCLAVPVSYFNDTEKIGKELDHFYDTVDLLLDELKSTEVKLDGKVIKSISDVFPLLDGFLQIYGNMVREINAVETFMINTYKALPSK